VGEAIRRALRTEDIAGRIGGDEFAVLLPYTRPIEAAHVVRRLRDEIQRLSGSLRGAAGEVEISASLGFETFDGADLDSLETLRLHAEIALREAKRLGGGRGVYYRSLESDGD
jgi:diguanylate cyclase (GGDEF)-like protein